MFLKSTLKRFLLRINKKIILDNKSEINFNIINSSINSNFPCRITNSSCHVKTINEGCSISDAMCYGDVNIGRFSTITGPGTIIKSLASKIVIGNFCSIGQNVCIVDFNHKFDHATSCFINYLLINKDFSYDIETKGPVIIEDDVWIGSNSIILSGVKIGRGSIIGGGSVVTKDIPKYSIAFGNPARVNRMRFQDNVVSYLENIRWWQWDIDKIRKNKTLFNSNLNNSLSEFIKHSDNI